MRKIHIKFDLPYNWGSLRKYGLYFDRLPKQYIMTGQNRSFDVDDDQIQLRIKLDFYNSEITLPKGNDDVYITIGMKGENPLQWTLNSFTRKALELKTVSPKEFAAFDFTYSKTNEKIAKLDGVSMTLSSLTVCYFIFLMFYKQLPESMVHLLLATVVISATGIFVMFKDKRTITAWSYKLRMGSTAILLFVVLTVLSYFQLINIGWILVLIPLLVFIRTFAWNNVISIGK